MSALRGMDDYMSRSPVDYGSAEWAVVTGSVSSTVLFVRLEASGEEAFMDVVGVHDNWLCGSPEYWPDVGERIQVCRVPISYPDNSIRVVRWESALEGVLGEFPTHYVAMPPGLGPIERAVVVAHRDEDLLVRLVESGRECTLPAAFLSHYPAERVKERWPAVGEREIGRAHV